MSDPRFSVIATNVSPDASLIARDLGRRPLGKLDAEALTALLEKFALLASASDDDCDPHFTVTGRVGTFAIRAAAGTTLLVYDVADTSHNFIKMEPAKLTAFLDYGPSGVPSETSAPSVSEPLTTDAPTRQPRHHYRIALAALAALAGLATLAVSAQLSFVPEMIDADVPYVALGNASEVARLRNTAAGEYLPQNSTRSALTINADGTIRYVAREFDGSIASDRVVASEPALLTNQTPVFRTSIGPVEIKSQTTVVFAGETFIRKR